MKFKDKYRIIFKIENSYAGVGFVEGVFISGYKDLDFIFVYENKNLEGFLSEDEVNRAYKIGYDFCVNREKTKKLHKEINQFLKEVRKFWAQLDELDFSKLDDKELKKFFIKYGGYMVKIYNYFSLTEFYYFYKVEDFLEEVIRSKDDLATLLTSPKLGNILAKEQFERFDLTLKIKKSLDREENFVKNHLKNFDYIPYAGGKVGWNIQSFNGVLNKLLRKSSLELTQERDKIVREDHDLQLKQEQIVKRLKLSKKSLNLILSVKEWQEIKWLLRIFINRTFVGIDCFSLKFLRELSKRYKYTISEIANMYYQETLDLLDGKKISSEEIKKRIDFYAGFNDGSKVTFIFGEKAKEFAQKVRKRTVGYFEKLTILRGRTASLGLVRAKARVFSGGGSGSFQRQLTSMKKGEILVAESTSPEYMPAILKAAAIVADEGGITSHAAIISRELKIPCVVGTHYAIRNIKTGDLIEVDANNGIVRKLN